MATDEQQAANVGGNNGARNRNILLETFDNIRDDLRRGEHLFKLRVRVCRGRQIQGGNVSPKVCIVFKKQRRWTQRETVSTNDPHWGESFYLNCMSDLESLLRENVTFCVVNSRMFRRNRVIGEFQLSLVLVAGEPSRSMINKWLALVDPNDPTIVCKGFLQVCVSLVFPNEPEVPWPDPLFHNEGTEDIEAAVITCSGHAFLKMSFVLSVYFMTDIPRHDMKGTKVTEVALGLSIAGKCIISKPIPLPEEADFEPIQIRKQVKLTVSWPTMCNKLAFSLFSVHNRRPSPLCSHAFFIQDIAVESSSALKRNVKSQDQADTTQEGTKGKNKTSARKSTKTSESKSAENKRDGFMPKIGPCFVNLYGAPLDAFEDKIDAESIKKMNSGEIEGCAYRGRVFVRLQSSLCESSDEEESVKDLILGLKEERDLQTYARSNTFLLFGYISTVPLVSDAKSTIQFEMSIGHSGINNISAITKSNIYPSTSFSINPKELLQTQRQQSGHSYFTLALDNEKPALLIETSWEDIRYRLHFYNLVSNLRLKWEQSQNVILMSYKLGLSQRKTLILIRDMCYDQQQNMLHTPIPSNSPLAAEMNEMDVEWKAMRFQQLKDIYRRLSHFVKTTIAAENKSASELSVIVKEICDQLTEISLLFDNIMKEPQLSIPDIFVYMLVNNERRAYARVPVASIYFCQSEATARNPVDDLGKPPSDYTKYRGFRANKVVTLYLQHIPGIPHLNAEDFWPIPAMIRIKLLFGLTTAMRANVLPPVNYYGVIYEYTRIPSCIERLNNPSSTFHTDASGLNTIDPTSTLMKAQPTSDEDGAPSWNWNGDWTPWPDTSVLINSDVETDTMLVYMVHMRDKSCERGKAVAWKFIGFYTEDMNRIPWSGNRLDINYALDPSSWIVVKQKNQLTGEEVGWIEVKGSEEYSKDLRFIEGEVTETVRLESNFARKLLQRKCKRKDKVYTESIRMLFKKSKDNRWSPTKIYRFDGFGRIVDMNEATIRSWTQLQQLSPMPVEVAATRSNARGVEEDNDNAVRPSGEAADIEQTGLKTFKWVDDWHELISPTMSDDNRTAEVTYERRKIMQADRNDGPAEGAYSWRCDEYASSIYDGIFHIAPQNNDRLRRCRLRRLIEPSEVSLILQSTVRERTVKLAPFPSFKVQRRVGKRSRICCLFNNLEQIPTPITVTAVVDTAHISRWEMRCFLHEARDLIVSENNERLEVYAIISVGGSSAPSAIIKNDLNTQLWRWNETIILRNLIFHEDSKQVASSPPNVIIEFFRKLPIHNDLFLGRCIIDSDNIGINSEGREADDKNIGFLQWYTIYLPNKEEAGSILAGFHFRHRDTFRPPLKVFENSFLTPARKDMQELVLSDRAVMDNMVRFEIPDEILPRLVPHILKITSWGLRELRKYMMSRVSRPTIEFRIGHTIIQTETLLVEKSPNFGKVSHSLLMRLPVEVSYLPELFIVVKDARTFGRAPLTGMTRIPLQLCRSERGRQVTELEAQELDFFITSLDSGHKLWSKTQQEPHKHLSIPLRTDLSREFYFLFKPPAQQFVSPKPRSLSDQDFGDDAVIRRSSDAAEQGPMPTRRDRVMNRIRGALVNLVIPESGDQPQLDVNFSNQSVRGNETLSKTKPDWWCKYFLSKFNNTEKAISYLEGDRLEFYAVPLEESEVDIGDPNTVETGLEIFNQSPESRSNSVQDEEEQEELLSDVTPQGRCSSSRVQYKGFNDIFESISLDRTNKLTSDEEGKRFGIFLGTVRLYYLGPIGEAEERQKLEELKSLRNKSYKTPYMPLYNNVPTELANQECLVRVYVVRALELQAGNFSSLPNSFVEVFIADNNKEIQLKNNRDSSVEMDNNPVYGCMFELYAIIPFQTRLRVRVMDKSSFFMDEEIGSTTIDLEKRLTTVYRATCGLPQCYRQGGVNSWRDLQKPSQILGDVCRRFQLAEPTCDSEEVPMNSQDFSVQGGGDDVKITHRYTMFPPNYNDGAEDDIDETGQQSQDDTTLHANSNKRRPKRKSKDVSRLPPVPADLPTDSAVGKILLKKGNYHSASRPDSKNKSNSEPGSVNPVTFKLEDFDRMNEVRGIHLRPNDNEPEICRERLALNILRRLPLVREHVETRPLYSPLQPGMIQGRLEMWVDIFSLDSLKCESKEGNKKKKNMKAEEIISKVRNLLPSPVDITPREPQPYELRVVVWSVHEIISRSSMGADAAGDLYVRAWMEGLGDTQETDVHHKALEGEGEFNWRFVFHLDYLPHERAICGKQKVSLFNRVLKKIPPMLHIQVWDNRRFRFDDFIGSIDLNLSKLVQPSRERDECVMRNRWQMAAGSRRGSLGAQAGGDQDSANLFEVQRVYGYWPLGACKSLELGNNKPGAWMIGKVLMELEILSKEEAALKPAGLGRGDPNQHPHLPDPRRLGIHSNFWTAPFAAFRRLLWPSFKWHMLGTVFAVGFIAVLLCVTVYMPFHTLTSAMVDSQPPSR